jgi:hypothetical protein
MVDLRQLKASLEDLRLDRIFSVGTRDYTVIEQTADALDQTPSVRATRSCGLLAKPRCKDISECREYAPAY